MVTTNINFDAEIEDRLVFGLESSGFMCLEDAINKSFLEYCRNSVDQIIAENGQRFFSIIQPYKSLKGAFQAMAETPGFVPLLRNIARRLHSQDSVENFELYNVLRVIGGKEASKGAFEFHYDATVVTVLMPLYIPIGKFGTTGELVIMPNKRRYRSSPLINIVEKALFQNRIAYRCYKMTKTKQADRAITLKPGNLYFFAGYRTFHGNLPCTSGDKRATLIFHFGDPHAGSRLTKVVVALRKLREGRRLRAAAA